MSVTKDSGDTKKPLYCSFCGKSQHEVKKLIAGPTVFICDECVELCMEIIKEEIKTSDKSNKKYKARSSPSETTLGAHICINKKNTKVSVVLFNLTGDGILACRWPIE